MSADARTMEGKASIKNGVSRLVFSALAILLQLFWIFLLACRFNRYAEWVSIITGILALVLVLAIYSQEKTSSLKVPWIMLIMAFPLLGTMLYLLIGLSGSTRKMRHRYEEIDSRLFPYLHQDETAKKALDESGFPAAGVSRYLRDYGKFPVYRNTNTVFYPEAAQGLAAQKQALEQADWLLDFELLSFKEEVLKCLKKNSRELNLIVTLVPSVT